jgi:hypothetical protein
MLSIRLMGNGGNQMTTFMLLAAVLSVGFIASLRIRMVLPIAPRFLE